LLSIANDFALGQHIFTKLRLPDEPPAARIAHVHVAPRRAWEEEAMKVATPRAASTAALRGKR
jgi:hypothetical protein